MYPKSLMMIALAVTSTFLIGGVQDADPARSRTILRGGQPAAVTQEATGLPLLSSSRSAFAVTSQGSEDRKIEEAARELRTASSSQDRADAEKTLRELLSADYDSRLKGYEEYLDGLEKKLADMRDKLQRRRSAKESVIDLRVKVLEAEADDLGWPSRVRRDRFPRLIRGSTTEPATWVK